MLVLPLPVPERHDHGRNCVKLIANVDVEPQPYFIVERTAIEATQMFTVSRTIPARRPSSGSGSRPTGFPPRDS